MNDIGATEVAKRLKCQGLTLTIIPPAMSGLSAKWRVEGHMEGMRSLLAECKQLKEEHCEDCCCAQSWAALGITKYTGKSIPEEIEALKERAQKAEARCADQKRILDNIQKSVESGPDMVELDRLRTEAARWQTAAQLATAQRFLLSGQNDDLAWWDVISDAVKIDFMKRAAAALGCSPNAWLMTPERIKALEQVLKYAHKDIEYEVSETDEEVLRSMLAEAKQ